LGAAPKITSYSLYPDNYGNGIVNNGVDSDVRINVPLDDYKSGYPYMYCEMVTDRELADFVLEVTKPSTFVCTENNAAAFAARLFQQTTGKTVNAVDLSGLSSSRKVGQSIRALNGGSNMPPGGLPWSGSARRQRRHSRDFRDFRRVLQDRQQKPKRVLQSAVTVNSSQSCGF
jgi:hypothetical protein